MPTLEEQFQRGATYPGAELAVGAVSGAVAELNAAAEFLRSPYFTAQLVQGLQRAAAEATSPWLDRASAAAYARCSTSEIDKAAVQKFFTRYERGGTPLFLKAEIDAAIKNGNWRKK